MQYRKPVVTSILGMIILCLGTWNDSKAQDSLQVLTLKDAINIGMQNNYSIRIARNEEAISTNNYSLGNAGFLPDVVATAGQSKRIEDSKQVFSGSGIPSRTSSNAQTTNSNASTNLNWTIFDGFKMFTTYDKLQELNKLGRSQTRAEVESSVAQIIVAYYNIIQQQKTLNVLENTLEVSEQRIQIAETKKDLGSGSEYDLLQARTDYNADKAALIRQKVALNNAKILLTRLIGDDPNASFRVNETIDLDSQLSLANLRQKAMDNNVDLIIARNNQNVAKLEIKEIDAERYPTIDLNVGYSYSKTQSGSSFFEFSRSNGLNYGISATFDLFNGFDIDRRKQNAQIQYKNAQIALDDQKQQLLADLSSEYTNYIQSFQLVKLEQENLQYARQSLDIALERFKLGTIDSIELRESQRTLIDAESRLIDAQYQAKQAETELLRLSGNLVNDYR